MKPQVGRTSEDSFRASKETKDTFASAIEAISRIIVGDMEIDAFLTIVREAIGAAATGRFLETERGFQGQLLIEIARRLPLPVRTILEQEAQKTLEAHGLRLRPDIIIHEPFDRERHASRRDGNFAVFALKLGAEADDARDDYGKLAVMLKLLNYRWGIFVNINSTETHTAQVPVEAKGRIVCYAVSAAKGVIEERT